MSNSLSGKKILLGVCGSIAAYKAAILTRLLVKQNVEVQILMTKSATHFITPLTLSTLSKRKVISRFFEDGHKQWNNHVELGLWADAMLIAPASGSTIARLATGMCNDVLAATYLSARCPVFVAPAMDLDMWQHPATQRNIDYLKEVGNQIVPVGDGELASGLSGPGRLAEPEDIVQFLQQFFDKQDSGNEQPTLEGETVIITAGPTYEPIDPVRFIGNRSSGRMGIALAEEAARQGAKVSLVLGPTDLRPTNSAIEVVPVQTAQQMYEATVARFPSATIGILAAAVADYTPVETSDVKIKKKTSDLVLQLTKTKDILAHLGSIKKENQRLVGFALETNNEEENAQKKLVKKNLDFIVLNSLRNKGAGFRHTTNQITILDRHNNKSHYELKSKEAVATDIIQYLITHF